MANNNMIYFEPNFWNLRGDFYVGPANVKTHMSFVKLSTGKFVVFDTILIDQKNKKAVDELTNNGDLIEAVIATHPFHTTYFEPFYKLYPNAKFYGTPRHLRNIKSIPWHGSVDSVEVLKLYENEQIFMRITEGTDFVNPKEDIHFASVFVFHKPSKTVHNDDTLLYVNDPGCIGRCVGFRADTCYFYPEALKKCLYPTPEAPQQFKLFIEGIIHEWDFENLCTAHIDVKPELGKIKMIDTFVRKTIPEIDKLTKARAKK